jgi:hypothetical protein
MATLGGGGNLMKLHTVTISGSDNRTAAMDLLAISKDYPFVEWGILLSSNEEPKPRYPSTEWIASIEPLSRQGTKVSGHICGEWARNICKGRFPKQINHMMFQRIQINVAHCFQKEVNNPAAMAACLPKNREYIVQVSLALQEGVALAKTLQGYDRTISILFDTSGGHGVTPTQWPDLAPGMKCGFAGGLGPDNLEEALCSLSALVGHAQVWIDMESRVRSEDGEILDIDKVRTCLEIAGRYVM